MDFKYFKTEMGAVSMITLKITDGVKVRKLSSNDLKILKTTKFWTALLGAQKIEDFIRESNFDSNYVGARRS